MTSPGGESRTVTTTFVARISGYTSAVKQMSQTTRDFRGELTKAAQAGKLDAVSGGLTKFGIVGAAAFGLVTKAGMDFEQAMSRAQAGTKATGSDLDRLRQAAIDAGQATKYSATDAAEGITALGKAGLSTTDILSGGLTGALSLASAGELAVGDAAEDMASALAQFNLKGANATHVADLLAAGAGKAQGDVSDLAMALKQSGLVASQTGVSIEETTGSLAAFANAGLIGQDAGTSFKQMLLSLANPTGKAKELLDEYNISAFDAQGKFVGMAKFAGELHDKLANLTDQQRQAALATIFGSDAIRAASVLYSEGAAGIKDWTDKVNDAGYAAEQAATLQDNLRGDIEKLTGSVDTLAISSESGANKGLRVLTQAATDAVNIVGSLPGPVLTTGTVLGGLTSIAALGTAGWIKYQAGMEKVTVQLTAMGPAGAKAAAGLSAVGKAAGGAAIGIGVLVTADTALDQILGHNLSPNVDAAAATLVQWAKTGKTSGETARLFGDNMGSLAKDFDRANDSGKGMMTSLEAWNPIVKLFGEGWTQSAQKVDTVDKALASLVSQGKIQESRTLFAALRQELEAQGGTADQLSQKALPDYYAALQVAGVGTDDMTGKTGELKGALDEAADAGKTLIEVWEVLNGRTLDADEALQEAYQRVNDLTDAFKKNGPEVDGNTESAVNNRVALERAAKAAADAAQAYLDNGGKAEGAATLVNDFKTQAENAAIAAGGNATQVKDLADQLFRIPKNVTSNVVVNHISTWTQGTTGPQGQPLFGPFVPQRWGGIMHAATGRLVDAHITSSPTVIYGERATRREAFIPEVGNAARSMSILRTAASWFNADVMPRNPYRGGWYGGQASMANTANTAGAAPVTYVTIGDVTLSVDDVRRIHDIDDFLNMLGAARNNSRRGMAG